MREKTLKILFYSTTFLIIAFVIFYVIMYIYIWENYGGMPYSDVPSWVHWFMWG